MIARRIDGGLATCPDRLELMLPRIDSRKQGIGPLRECFELCLQGGRSLSLSIGWT